MEISYKSRKSYLSSTKSYGRSYKQQQYENISTRQMKAPLSRIALVVQAVSLAKYNLWLLRLDRIAAKAEHSNNICNRVYDKI